MSRSQNPILSAVAGDQVLQVTVASKHLRDLAGVARFERELRELAQNRAESRWVIDFGGTTFFITPACNTLLAVTRQLLARGGDLAFTGISQDVQYILGLLRMGDIFSIYPSMAFALAALEEPEEGPAGAAEAG